MLKSNLKRLGSGSPTTDRPVKRFRIVEDLDTVSGGCKQSSEPNQEPANQSVEEVWKDDLSTETEVECCEEKVVWINSSCSFIDQSSVNVESVRETRVPVKRRFSVEISMRFISTEAVNAVLDSKSSIARVGAAEFHLWVHKNSSWNNPSLNCVYNDNFMKLANIDALLNFDLTSPKAFVEGRGNEASQSDSIYFVGELWQNSKGFSEYIINKTSQHLQQFSTKVCAWKVDGIFGPLNLLKKDPGIIFQDESLQCSQNTCLPVQAVEQFGGSEELLDSEIIDEYIRFVGSRTNGRMLNLLIVDNPEISFVYESCREIRFQKYFYCQCLIALRSIREGGTFVCKIFDTFTLFTTGLLFLLHKCFKSITIHKPASSSPYTSERFLICLGKVDNLDSQYAQNFLSDCFDMVVNNQQQMKIVRRRVKKRLTVLKMEVQILVPIKDILSHAEFFQYIRRTNIKFSMELAESINHLCLVMEEEDKANLKQLARQLRKSYSDKIVLWNIGKSAPVLNILAESQEKFLRLQCENFLRDYHVPLDVLPIESKVENVSLLPELCASKNYESFVAFPVQQSGHSAIVNSRIGFFCGTSQGNIFHFDGLKWQLLNIPEFSLPHDTLVIGEISEEYQKTRNRERLRSEFVLYFHFFDALILNGVFMGSLPILKRQMILQRFLLSTRNLTSSLNVNCCVIPCLPMTELTAFYSDTMTDSLMGYPTGVRSYARCKSSRDNFSLVNGFLLIKDTTDTVPNDFFCNYKRLIWLWRQAEENFKVEDTQILSNQIA